MKDEDRSIPAIAARMRLLRQVTGLTQTDFARSIDTSRTVWNNVETEFARIGVDTAMRVRDRYRVTLDCIYFGDNQSLPHGLAKKVEEAAGASALEGMATEKDWLDLAPAKREA